MSSKLHGNLSENFLDEWLIEKNFPTNVPFQMKFLTYLGQSQLEIDQLKNSIPKKARGAPKKEIKKNMMRANKYLSAKEFLIERGYQNPSHKGVIEFLIQAANILYDNDAISKEDRDLFKCTSMKSIQNTISIGLKQLKQFPKKSSI